MVTKLPNNIIMIDKCFSVLGCLTDISYLNIKLSEMAIMKNWEPKWVYWWKCILSTGKCKNQSSKQKISLGSKYNICRVPKAHNSMGVIWDTLRNTCQDVFHRLLYIQIEPISNWLFKFIYSLKAKSNNLILKKIILIFPHFL